MRAGQGRAAAIGSPTRSANGRASATCFRSDCRRRTHARVHRLAHLNRRPRWCREDHDRRRDPRIRGRAGLRGPRLRADYARGQVAFRGRCSRRDRRQPPRKPIRTRSEAKSGLSTNRACSQRGRSIGSFTRHARKASSGSFSSATSASIMRSKRDGRSIRCRRPECRSPGSIPFAASAIPQLREAVTHAAKGEIAESLAILERRGDIREVADIEQRRKQIAREYVAAHQSGQRVLVVSPANDERRELNKAIRAELIARGHVSPLGTEQTILVNRGLSGAQRAMAYNYERRRCDPLHSRKQTVRDSQGRLWARRGSRSQTPMCLRSTRAGRAARPNTIQSGCSASKSFARSSAVLARGDRIQFRAPDRALGVANGDFATIKTIDAQSGRRCV